MLDNVVKQSDLPNGNLIFKKCLCTQMGFELKEECPIEPQFRKITQPGSSFKKSPTEKIK